MNHFNTDSLFSFTHLMLVLVFSRACSRARVPEPKPVSMLSCLNCSSCQENADSQPQAGSVAHPGGERRGGGAPLPWAGPPGMGTTPCPRTEGPVLHLWLEQSPHVPRGCKITAPCRVWLRSYLTVIVQYSNLNQEGEGQTAHSTMWKFLEHEMHSFWMELPTLTESGPSAW